MHHPHGPARLPVLAALALAVTLGGCSDQALIDRVAQLEASQERLRDSLTELGAPDPDALAAQDALAAEVAALGAQRDTLEGQLAGIRSDLDTQVLELDDRLTGAELEDDGLAASLAQLEAAVAALTDRVSSLEAQLDAHRDDPSGHGG